MKLKYMVALCTTILMLFASVAMAAYQKVADNTVSAYHNPELTQRTGNERVDKGDLVTVLEERSNAYYVRYPVKNGTKDRWVPKNIFNSTSRTTSPTNNTVTIGEGWYRIQPMHDLRRSLDALGAQVRNGNNVHMWESVDADQQKFYLKNQGDGYFSLQSAYGSRLFVTADGSNGGANLYTASWTGAATQLFRLISAGNGCYYVMCKAGDNLIFDCAGGGKANGTNVGLWWKDNTVDWYKWKFTRVNGPALPPTPTPSENWDSKIGQKLANINTNNYTKPTNPFNKSYTSSKDGKYHDTNCTWYAWGRMREVTGKSISPRGNAGTWHNSTAWDSNLTSKCVAERSGHVVFVEYVDNNRGYVYFTEVNWNIRDDYKVQRKTISEFKQNFKWFIH